VRALLKIAGDDYLPFLVANARAFEQSSPSARHDPGEYGSRYQ